jgi:hypothetical protein
VPNGVNVENSSMNGFKRCPYVVGAMVNVVANNILYYLMILGSNTKWI